MRGTPAPLPRPLPCCITLALAPRFGIISVALFACVNGAMENKNRAVAARFGVVSDFLVELIPLILSYLYEEVK